MGEDTNSLTWSSPETLSCLASQPASKNHQSQLSLGNRQSASLLDSDMAPSRGSRAAAETDLSGESWMYDILAG